MSPMWCHKGQWYLTDTSHLFVTKKPKQVFFLTSETTSNFFFPPTKGKYRKSSIEAGRQNWLISYWLFSDLCFFEFVSKTLNSVAHQSLENGLRIRRWVLCISPAFPSRFLSHCVSTLALPVRPRPGLPLRRPAHTYTRTHTPLPSKSIHHLSE